jgi:hypothetical protein
MCSTSGFAMSAGFLAAPDNVYEYVKCFNR